MITKARIETNRLVLRDNEESDLENLHLLLSDKKNMYFLDDICTETLDQTAENLKFAMANCDGHYFCIEHKASGEYIGQIGYTITEVTPLGKIVHLGFFILPRYHGKGYTAEAAKKVLGYAFTQDGCIRVTTGCYKDNIPSRRVMEKVGFRKEAERIAAQFHDGVMKDRLEYALNKNDWEALFSIDEGARL